MRFLPGAGYATKMADDKISADEIGVFFVEGPVQKPDSNAFSFGLCPGLAPANNTQCQGRWGEGETANRYERIDHSNPTVLEPKPSWLVLFA